MKLSNTELSKAITDTTMLIGKCVPGNPQDRKMKEHLNALIDEQLRRAVLRTNQ